MTAGGNAPGYNSFVKGAAKEARQRNIRLLGLHNGLQALMEKQHGTVNLAGIPPKILNAQFSGPGSALGVSRVRIDTQERDPETIERVLEMTDFYRKKHEIEGLIVAGGDGTTIGMTNALDAGGFPFVIGPVSIDNDIDGNDTTVGFHSATERLDQIVEEQIADVSAHTRIMVMQVQGRDSGMVALKGGRKADIVLLGECPVSNEQIIRRTTDVFRDQHYGVIVVAENFEPEGYEEQSEIKDPAGNPIKGNRAKYVAEMLQRAFDERNPGMREEVHAQDPVFVRDMDLSSQLRAVKPYAKDSRFARGLGASAVALADADLWNYMVMLKGPGNYVPVPIKEVRGGQTVDPDEYDFSRLCKHSVPGSIREFIRKNSDPSKASES